MQMQPGRGLQHAAHTHTIPQYAIINQFAHYNILMSFYVCVCIEPAVESRREPHVKEWSQLNPFLPPPSLSKKPPTASLCSSIVKRIKTLPPPNHHHDSKKLQVQSVHAHTPTSSIKPHQLKSKLTEMFAHSNVPHITALASPLLILGGRGDPRGSRNSQK